MRRIAVLDAPSNLGLRPPTGTSVPGCAKAPGALRDHDLIARLGARDAGCLTPPRYDPGDWRPGDGVCHAASIASYSMRLADRVGTIIDRGEFPLVLGGDCAILLGSALAMHRLGEAVGGRVGLVFVDGHSDFRHPGNASYVGAAAGEDLALVTGRGQADLAAIEGRRPYFRDIDVVVLGIRSHDEYRLDLQAAGIVTRPVPALRAEGAARTAQWAHDQLTDCVGYWVHVDVDVLDPAVMPAVDAPDPGGIAFAELELLLAGLVDTPHCLGVEVTVFDPDYDPDGAYAAEIVGTLVAGLSPVTTPDVVPPRLLPSGTPAGPGPAAVPGPRYGPTGSSTGGGAREVPPLGLAGLPRPSPVVAAEPVGPPPSAGPGRLRRPTVPPLELRPAETGSPVRAPFVPSTGSQSVPPAGPPAVDGAGAVETGPEDDRPHRVAGPGSAAEIA
ncbi:arginase family protein [Plantactinospora sp. B24E8]|uniref:arginase family protein n=1 Tax=Plantactinospora sp. B24E8 TaxID=3153567 RepID=UPI00325D98F5